MNVLVDMTHITPDKLYASLSIYVFRILDAMPAAERKHFTLLIPSELEDFTRRRYPDYAYLLFPATRAHVSRHKLLRIAQQIRVYRRIVNSSGCDILFIANDLYPYTHIRTRLKKVVVIHDLKVIKDTPRSWAEKIARYLNFRFYASFMKHAEVVVAISNYTRQDILTHYPSVRPEKIKVIYNSVLLAKEAVSPFKKSSAPEDYLLYVNTLQPHKNPLTLLKAFQLLKDKISHSLVLVGKETSYWKEELLPYLQAHQLESRILHLQNLREEELRYVYEHARLFITPSLREGFGYTPIEAALCQCPVVCSTCEALPDTTRQQLVYYQPPQDAEALAETLLRTLQNPPSPARRAQIAADYQDAYSCARQVQDFLTLFHHC